MEIIEIRKHSLHNMEHYQFATQVIKLCEEAGIEKLKTLLKTLKDAVAEEDKALNIPRKKEGTADLEALDRARDHAYRALQLLVEMNLLSEDVDEQKAAQKMENVMSRYPKVTTSNYNKESALIKNLVSDLQDAKLAEAVTKLAATEYITRLSKANEAFDKRYLDALKTIIPTGTYDIKALRTATDKALSAVALRIKALADLAPETPKLDVLISEYNANSDKFRATVAHREGNSKSAQEKRSATEEKLLKPGFEALETKLNLAKNSLKFTGKAEGRGSKRHYELAIAGQTTADGKPKTIWVSVDKDGVLEVIEKTITIKKKPAEK